MVDAKKVNLQFWMYWFIGFYHYINLFGYISKRGKTQEPLALLLSGLKPESWNLILDYRLDVSEYDTKQECNQDDVKFH